MGTKSFSKDWFFGIDVAQWPNSAAHGTIQNKNFAVLTQFCWLFPATSNGTDMWLHGHFSLRGLLLRWDRGEKFWTRKGSIVLVRRDRRNGIVQWWFTSKDERIFFPVREIDPHIQFAIECAQHAEPVLSVWGWLLWKVVFPRLVGSHEVNEVGMGLEVSQTVVK